MKFTKTFVMKVSTKILNCFSVHPLYINCGSRDLAKIGYKEGRNGQIDFPFSVIIFVKELVRG